MATTLKHEGLKIVKGHTTTLKNGAKVPMSWTIDFTGCDDARIREWASETLVIRARQKTNLKELTEAEAKEKYGVFTIVAKDIAKLERVAHVETEQEKQFKQMFNALPADQKEAKLAQMMEMLAQAKMEAEEAEQE